MDFIERINVLARRIPQIQNNLLTEEATKNALIMPFLDKVLGWDVYDPTEVIPEFTADTASKKGEKVDYALMKDGEVQILIECKKYGEKLTIKHASQLFRYFSVTNARLAILTNGAEYQIFTDSDAPNKMDEKPFLKFDLESIDEHIIPEVKKLAKSVFNIDSIVSSAGELKYLSQIKKIIAEQFKEPEEEFVRFFASRSYEGTLTPKVKQQFYDITHKALMQFLSDSINERLKTALSNDKAASEAQQQEVIVKTEDEKAKVVTTSEEIEGYNIIKAILRQKVDLSRVIARDTQSYFGILLDDNNRKPLCRLHFNAKQKYLGIIGPDKDETRHPIDKLDDIFNFSEQLLNTATFYE
ncbi:type I restriction endonuclease [Shewanella putrefaciens]|uniref:type I restriction endonuclease n=1 Tax=Shewanella putrefaciens TaxID=24 RepID=UPI0018E74B57|nr:type I restriction endonuclease [Shewanella putrefaciens]